MKIKILAIAVAGILLSGCGNDDNGSFPTLAVQAYDPAIRGMTATADCVDATPELKTTDQDGNAKFISLAAISAPETCKFTFVGGPDAIDMSNSKSMDGVTYIIPKGLARLNAAAITATPISTLIAKTLGDDVAYNESTATQVMTELGLGDLINNGDINVTEFLLNTQSAMKNLETKSATAFSQLSAVTTVLTDVLKTNEKAADNAKISVGDIAKSSKALAKAIIIEHKGYPKNDAGNTIVITIDETLVKSVAKDVSEGTTPTIVVPKEKPAIVVPKDDKPATGGSDGTGGTGGSSNDNG